jgi:hypothetical protein
VRCSMMPRYCIMLLSVTPALPSISVTAVWLQPILLKMFSIPALRLLTVFMLCAAFCSYMSAFCSVFASRSSSSCRKVTPLSLTPPPPLP